MVNGVSSISTRDRKILESLVRDCIIYDLDECESMEYIKKRAIDIPISRSYFYTLRKRISDNDANIIQERLAKHARVGFALKALRIYV